MPDALSLAPQRQERKISTLVSRVRSNIRSQAPTRIELTLATFSAVLLILSFPNFNWWPLAWIGLMPLLVALLGAPKLAWRAFLLGWITGTIFLYGSCYWLTYAAIRYGHIPTVFSYLLLIPATAIGGLFAGFFALILARVAARFGSTAVFIAPFVWVALEWARFGVTGQLWNALGYSQAYVPKLIQSSQWGGVYAVGFLIVGVNASLAFLFVRRTKRASLCALTVIASVAGVIALQAAFVHDDSPERVDAVVVAIQPNVPMEPIESVAENDALVARHFSMSNAALRNIVDANVPRIIVWPESPMNFMYARDSRFREMLAEFTQTNRTSVIFNALEPAPAGGSYNAAVMVNEEGRLLAQYDKIRLLPFGEYVPLPRWFPGASLIPVMVGDFTPGTEYPLLPLGNARAGIFICFESAFPYIARRFANDGADVLINISNDGYLGPTPVMKQHLANAVYRAVENNRPLLRVTNTGITAYITPRGEVKDATNGFQTAVRTWRVSRSTNGKTFYTKHGDLFVGACAALSLLLLVGTFSKPNNLINWK